MTRGEKPIDTKIVLEKNELTPIELQAKDGLALINGTQMMTAYGAYVLERFTPPNQIRRRNFSDVTRSTTRKLKTI